MHWPPEDRPADVPDDGFDPDAGFASEAGFDPADPAAEAPAFVSPFAGDVAAADSPWPNRVIFAAAAAAGVCAVVWGTGLWEVRLDDPPAGVAADPADASPAPLAGDWGADDDWPENATAEADLDSVWGDDPDAAPAGAADAAAYDLLADAPRAEAPAAAASGTLGDVSFDRPETPPVTAPADPLASSGDLWGDPEPPQPPLPDSPRGPAEPAGGLYSVTPAPGSPAAGSPVRSAEVSPVPADAASAAAAPAVPADPAAAADPFGDDSVFSAPAVASPAAPVAPGSPAVAAGDAAGDPLAEDPFAGMVTPASAASAGPAAAVTTADESSPFESAPADPQPEPAAAPAAPADGPAPDYLSAIDAAVAAGEVLQAHTELSRLWWDAPADRAAVRGRLDGTARQIYFDATSHFMTPRTVAAGETLEDVAADLLLPEMYLARVNRVAPAAVRPGDELKVIRGPFGAALDLSAGAGGGGTLTVHAHGYYVRAFAAAAPAADAPAVAPGEYAVAGKVHNARGMQILLTNADGGMLRLTGGPPPPGRPAVALAPADMAQVFDLLANGGTVSVRP